MQEADIVKPAARDAPIGGNDLAEGLMLVRASTLKVIRLHLAMERQDRKAALAAVDDLVALDHRLQDFLALVPEFHDALLEQEVEADRSALNREKLTLAAGISSRHPARTPSFEEPKFIREEPAGPNAAPEPVPDPWDWPSEATPESAERRARRWPWLVIVALSVALAAAAYFFGTAEGARILAA